MYVHIYKFPYLYRYVYSIFKYLSALWIQPPVRSMTGVWWLGVIGPLDPARFRHLAHVSVIWISKPTSFWSKGLHGCYKTQLLHQVTFLHLAIPFRLYLCDCPRFWDAQTCSDCSGANQRALANPQQLPGGCSNVGVSINGGTTKWNPPHGNCMK